MANPRSIYGSRNTGRTIYGGASNNVCDTTNTCLTNELLVAFYDMTVSIRSVVDKLFPAARATSAYIANMGAVGGLSPVFFVRLVWRRRYVGELFTGTPAQILQIEDIYLEYDLTIDPTKDALFAK